MFISVGWYCAIGGVWGAIKIATAKKLFKSDFANQEGVIKAEDYATEVPMTPLRRWTIVGVCIIIAIVGLFMIEHDHNWNPFQS